MFITTDKGNLIPYGNISHVEPSPEGGCFVFTREGKRAYVSATTAEIIDSFSTYVPDTSPLVGTINASLDKIHSDMQSKMSHIENLTKSGVLESLETTAIKLKNTVLDCSSNGRMLSNVTESICSVVVELERAIAE